MALLEIESLQVEFPIGGNVLRAMEGAERAAATLRGEPMATGTVAGLDAS